MLAGNARNPGSIPDWGNIFRIKFITVFKIKFGKFGRLLIFQIDCIESPTTIGMQL